MKSMIGVCEKFSETDGDDVLLKNVVLYSLRMIATLGDPQHPRGDWTPDEIRKRINSDACGIVVVVLDMDGRRDLGPKCYAAIDAAQKANKPYLILAPIVRWLLLHAHREESIALTREGCPVLAVPAGLVTNSWDLVIEQTAQALRGQA